MEIDGGSDRVAPERGGLPYVLGALSLAAALIHGAAVSAHGDHRLLSLLFAATAAAQGAWALVVVSRPTRPVLAAGIVLNGGVLGAYVLTRLVGLPIDGLRSAEAIGTQDLVCALLEVGVIVGAAALLVPTRQLGALRRLGMVPAAVVAVVVLVGAVPAVAAGHGHGDDDHAHGDATAAHDHPDEHGDEHGEHDGEHIPGEETATPEQRERALAMVEDAKAVASRWPTTEAAEADGYTSIGDGRNGYEHFVHGARIASPTILDPHAPESLVYEVAPDGTKTLASLMYILAPGATMADVPDIAADMTTWHDHQNLCWGPDGRLAGLKGADGVCRPGGTFRSTPPMLHVWVVDNPCGPFAGIEGGGPAGGHGESCDHSH